jgi:hypothetical protein
MIFHGPAITYIKLSERLLSRLSSAAYYFCLSISILWNDFPSEILAVIFASVALCSSQFGRQLILFVTPLLALLFLNTMPLIVFAGGLLLSLVLYRGYFIKSMVFNFKCWGMSLNFYNKDNKELEENVLSNYLSLKRIVKLIKQKNLPAVIDQLVRKEPTRILWFMPEVIFFIAIVFCFRGHQSLQFLKLLTPVLLAYLLTSIRKFNQFGESYRYIEYGLYFALPFYISYMLVSHYSMKTEFMIIEYFEYVALLLILHSYFGFLRWAWPVKDELQEFLDNLKLGPQHTVFPIAHNTAGNICARVEANSFWWQPGGITDPALYKEYFDVYPYLKKDFIPLFKKHNVTHIIADKSYLKDPPVQYDFSQFTMVSESERYIAYLVN